MGEAERIRERFAAAGQGHVFHHWDALKPESRLRLIQDAGAVDLDRLTSWTRSFIDRPTGALAWKKEAIEPAPYLRHPQYGGDRAAWERAEGIGATALLEGKVAAFTVAGGQGTRLGYGPVKGAVPATPIQEKSLFQVFAEKIRSLGARYGVTPPWLILTSSNNHADTVAFFKEHDFFGLDPSSVHCFPQGQYPAVDAQGKLLLAAEDRLVFCPDGHGGALSALYRSRLIDELRARGISLVTYFQIDNPLLHCFDPSFIGFHLQQESELSSKVVQKHSADEKVGVFARHQGRLITIEYSDLPEDLRMAKDANGALSYCTGNIAAHLFSLDFMKCMGAPEAFDKLGIHRADKAIEAFDPLTGKQGTVAGIKFEHFIFDALPYAQEATMVEALREEEFSPIKNAQGADSLLTCRADQMRRWANWLRAAGVDIPVDAQGMPAHPIEISPLFADDFKTFLARWEASPRLLDPNQSIYIDA